MTIYVNMSSSQFVMENMCEREEMIKKLKQEPIDIKEESELTTEENEFYTNEEYKTVEIKTEPKEEPNDNKVGIELILEENVFDANEECKTVEVKRETTEELFDKKVETELTLKENDFYVNKECELSLSHSISDTNTERNIFVGIVKVEEKNAPSNTTKSREIMSSGKKLQCNDCKKLFSYKSKLIRHIRIHNHKAFKCNVCEKKFTQKSHLASHERDVTLVKNLISATFVRKNLVIKTK